MLRSKRSKRYREAIKKYDKTKLYELKEGFELLLSLDRAKFDETVEATVKLGVNPKHADQNVRGTVSLPHGTGKKVKVLVFAKGEKENEAKEAGADYVGTDYIEKIEKGWLDFNAVIATPDAMRDVGKLGRILGPRGLMPNPKTGTVTFDVATAVKDIKAGRIEFKTDKYGIVHVPLGKVSFGVEKLCSNFLTFYESILKAKPSSVKGQYVKGVFISASMGPGIKIDYQKIGLGK